MTIEAFYHVGKTNLPASNVADPALNVLCGLLKSAIMYDCQNAYLAMRPAKAKWDGYVLSDVVPFSIEPWLAKGNKLKFPLLSISRKSSSYEGFTLSNSQRVSEWTIDYVLPETALEEYAKVNTLLNLIPNSIYGVIERRGHPAYLDGYSGILGAVAGGAGFWSVDVTAVEFGNWEIASENKDGIIHPVVRITLKTVELFGPGYQNTTYPYENYDPSLEALEETEVSVSVEELDIIYEEFK